MLVNMVIVEAQGIFLQLVIVIKSWRTAALMTYLNTKGGATLVDSSHLWGPQHESPQITQECPWNIKKINL